MYVFEGDEYSGTTGEEEVVEKVEISSWKFFGGFLFPRLEVSLTLILCNSNAEFSNASLQGGGNKRNWQKWKWNILVSSFREPKMNSNESWF